MSPRIVLVPPSEATAELARAIAPTGFELVMPKEGDIKAHLGEAEYMICYPHIKMDDAFHKAAPKLKLIQLLSAGYDNVDLEAARRAKVPVANNGGANAISVAEHAVMLMLTTARRVVWQHASVSGGRWRGNGPPPTMYELYDKTLGIIGLGNIGKKVARRAQAFGMKVEYYDVKRLSEDEEDALGVKFRLLKELLRRSDFISLHVPLNASTRHLIGAGELALMKPSAIIVNTSRGPVIDEKALHATLAAHKIFGAGLDVFDQEPPPPNNPLFGLDNVVLTAHFAGPTSDNHTARFRNAFDNAQRVARGEQPFWVVPELADLLR
ncbi:MAG TPA: 2-hydroxyacid dehydrogenase [Hyphomicrobiaceae bacterium]|nr:2-hydroxyacid dehydrogenase [Hyphomicrobiaceae bacterium]